MAKLLTVDQTAERLQVHRNTVVGLIDSGELEASKVRKRWRIAEAAIADYLERGSNKKKRGDTAKAAS